MIKKRCKYIKKNHNKKLGKYGESRAIEYLQSLGYEILERNFFSRSGEIDIIAKDKSEYVFVEVKSRKSCIYGYPIESINKKKKKHIIKSSEYFIYKNDLNNKPIRFDVIEVYIHQKNGIINHIKNLFF